MTSRECQIDGCERMHHAHGFCDEHADAWMRNAHEDPACGDCAAPLGYTPSGKPRRGPICQWCQAGRSTAADARHTLRFDA